MLHSLLPLETIVPVKNDAAKPRAFTNLALNMRKSFGGLARMQTELKSYLDGKPVCCPSLN